MVTKVCQKNNPLFEILPSAGQYFPLFIIMYFNFPLLEEKNEWSAYSGDSNQTEIFQM